MEKLSSPHSQLKSSHQVVIVGSGYGGGVSASRLARAGQDVCVLERGREFSKGEFPSTMPQLLRESQIRTSGKAAVGGHASNPLALLDLHIEKEMSVLRGCGLGGGSLVNASVSVEADPKVFADSRWPTAFRDDVSARLAEGYQRAREVLDPKTYPDSWPVLGKCQAHFHAGKSMGETTVKVPLNISFEDRTNPFGVRQPACNLCGDCITGCNTGSKTTVTATYLADAWNHGAKIFTEVSVRHIASRPDGRWAVHYDFVGSGRDAFDADRSLVIVADIVILAAGALGSTEILLRSKAAGISVSDRLGHSVASNGCTLGFSFDGKHKINGVAGGPNAPEDHPPVGPCITTMIDGRTPERSLEEQFVIEESSLPSTLRPLYPAFPLVPRGLESIRGSDADAQDSGGIGAVRGKSKHGKTTRERVAHSQTMLGMGVDKSSAQLYLDEEGNLRGNWQDPERDPTTKTLQRMMSAATDVMEGSYIPNPMSSSSIGTKGITVHPLGGCAMGEDAERGVTDHRGAVFCDSKGSDVHEGLFVMDGSVMPLALGVNPLLTISAIAERNVALLAEARGWTVPYDLHHRPAQSRGPETTAVGVRFTERMAGYFAPAGRDQDYQSAADAGRAKDMRLSMLLTVGCEDLDATLSDPGKVLYFDGTVDAPHLCPEPLQVRDGRLALLVGDTVQIGMRTMRYDMTLHASDGRCWRFRGTKQVKGKRVLDIWRETTTLNVTIAEQLSGAGRAPGRLYRGVVRITVKDFVKQLATLRSSGTSSLPKAVQSVGRFAKYFTGSLAQSYGGRLAAPSVHDVEAPPRKRRPLRARAPQHHNFKTSDGVPLLLTNYRGGFRGPVLLVHGLGVSSDIFTVDTIGTNLTEYLVAHGYDVWLLDYRASIALDASHTQFTGDDIANIDLPEAVQQILRHTGAKDVQVVAHCFGATTFFMSMLSGKLQNVRSAVVSQASPHLNAAALTRVKSRLRLPSLLRGAGIKSMSAYTDSDAGLLERLYDRSLSLQPTGHGETCSSATCRRISFLYSSLYRHEKLAVQTHDNLHELFGTANLSAMEHLASMVRAGHLVDAKGKNVYLPHVERLAIPLRIIHGEHNACFSPAGSQESLAWLRANNDPKLYSRVVVPEYGHIDTIFGKNAVVDVFPHILEHLDQANLECGAPGYTFAGHSRRVQRSVQPCRVPRNSGVTARKRPTEPVFAGNGPRVGVH